MPPFGALTTVVLDSGIGTRVVAWDLVEVIVPRLNVVVEVTVSPTSVTVEAAVAVMKKIAVSVTVCANALKQRRRSKLSAS